MINKQTFNELFSSITAVKPDSFIIGSQIYDDTTIIGSGWGSVIPNHLIENAKRKYCCIFFLTPLEGLMDASYIHSKMQLLKLGITSHVETELTAIIKRKQKQNINFNNIASFINNFSESNALNVLLQSLLKTYLTKGYGTNLLIDRNEVQNNSSIENHIVVAFEINDDNTLQYIATYTKQAAKVLNKVAFTTTNEFIVGKERITNLDYVVYEIEGDEHNENHLSCFTTNDYTEALEYLKNNPRCVGIHARTEHGWIYDISQQLDLEKINKYFNIKNERLKK